jgi:3-phenylpropionate/trans-cinnamate dioxygenase ferredoxin subunit
MEEAALPEGGLAPVYPRGVHVVVARVDGTPYAFSGKCAHMACPLSGALLQGHILTCPCHDWRYDVRTGRFLDAPELGLTVFPVKSEEGRLLIGLE